MSVWICAVFCGIFDDLPSCDLSHSSEFQFTRSCTRSECGTNRCEATETIGLRLTWTTLDQHIARSSQSSTRSILSRTITDPLCITAHGYVAYVSVSRAPSFVNYCAEWSAEGAIVEAPRGGVRAYEFLRRSPAGSERRVDKFGIPRDIPLLASIFRVPVGSSRDAKCFVFSGTHMGYIGFYVDSYWSPIQQLVNIVGHMTSSDVIIHKSFRCRRMTTRRIMSVETLSIAVRKKLAFEAACNRQTTLKVAPFPWCNSITHISHHFLFSLSIVGNPIDCQQSKVKIPFQMWVSFVQQLTRFQLT